MIKNKIINKDNLYDAIKKAQAYGSHDSWYRLIYPHLTRMRAASEHNNYLAMVDHFIQNEEYINELIEILESNGEL